MLRIPLLVAPNYSSCPYMPTAPVAHTCQLLQLPNTCFGFRDNTSI
ncbi:unnamed protein product [Prunus brigantina]